MSAPADDGRRAEGYVLRFFSHLCAEMARQFAARRESPPPAARRRVALACILIFFLALGVRLLSWQDHNQEAVSVHAAVSNSYRRAAHLLLAGELRTFLSEQDLLGHPPGYPLLMAAVFGLFGAATGALQFLQILCDALAAVVVALIVLEMLPLTAAAIAGALVALNPFFAFTALTIHPDSLAVLPLLVAVYLIIRAGQRPRLAPFLIAGALVGLSCWLRPNALFLPFFLAAVILVACDRDRRRSYAAAFLGAALACIAPVTVKNYIMFGQVIPLSLGAGQTLIEGIGDYDPEGRFGMPRTDVELQRQEAQMYDRPDYAASLFGADAVRRDRMRLRRAFAIIRAHPGWFLGVMLRRATTMLRLARGPAVLPAPAVTHSLSSIEQMPPARTLAPAELMGAGAVVSPQATVALAADGQSLRLSSDDSLWGEQLVSAPLTVREDTDYALRLRIRVERGILNIRVTGADRSAPLGQRIVYLEPQSAPVTTEAVIPFVSRNTNLVHVALSNGGARTGQASAQVEGLEIYELGPASYLWTRYPRVLIRLSQKFFATAVILPFIFIGIVLLAAARQGRALALLLAVPVYYLCAQSALHTEYRYVIAMHYFGFALAAIAIYSLGRALWQGSLSLRLRKRGPVRG